jgi:hypothetical protein
VKRHWALAASFALYWGATAAIVRAALRHTGGVLVYPLDDAYIHMAMAKNVALYHVWGVTRHEFTSSTSSPLWTALLAAIYSAIGVRTIVPLLVNLAFGTAILAAVYVWLQRRSATQTYTFAALACLTLVAPLPTLTFLGMEHTAHTLMTLWFVMTSTAALSSPSASSGRRLILLAVPAALLVALRYEGLFAVAIVALLFLFVRKVGAAAAVVVAAGFPVAMYGLWSKLHGWYLLPNSVLLKGRIPAANPGELVRFAFGSPALHNLVLNPLMLLIVVAALLALLFRALTRQEWDADNFLLAIVAGVGLLHAEFSIAGGLYRYEAYWVTLACASAAVILAGAAPAWPGRGARLRTAAPVAVALLAVAGFPFASRALNALRNAPRASTNIFEQQYQMGTFVRRFYQGRTVVLNDIGAVNFLADIKVVDAYGLATLPAADLKRRRAFVTDRLADLATVYGADVALVYTSWLDDYGGVPAAWVRVGDWAVADNVVLGAGVVSIFAVQPSERAPLESHLRQFAADLPARITQSGEYTLASRSR